MVFFCQNKKGKMVMKATRHNGRSGKLGLTMLSIMTADLMWRIVSTLTQRGRNTMSIGTAIRVIVCQMMKTKEQDLLSQKSKKRMTRNKYSL